MPDRSADKNAEGADQKPTTSEGGRSPSSVSDGEIPTSIPIDGEAIRRAAEGAVDAVRRLRSMASLFRDLGRNASPDRLRAIKEVDAFAEGEIKTIVEESPSFVVGLVRDSVLEVVANLERVESGSNRKQLGWLASRIEHVAYDPRNAAEAADALDAIADAIVRVPRVRQLTTAALDALEDHNILGESVLSDLVSMLAALAYGGILTSRIASDGEVELVVGSRRVRPGSTAGRSASISRNSLGIWTAKIQVPNPVWPSAALRFKLTGHRQDGLPVQASTLRLDAPIPVRTRGGRVTISPYAQTGLPGRGSDVEKQVGVNVTARFGANLPAASVKLEGWTLPYDERLSSQPVLVCVPAARGLPRWVRHDPIPESLRSSNPIETLRRRVFVEVVPGVEHAEDLAGVVLAGLVLVGEVLEPELAARVFGVLQVRFRPESYPGAVYDSGDGVLEIFQHPTSPHATIHELAHHLDRLLGDLSRMAPHCYATRQRGNPIHDYARKAAELSAPHLAPVVGRHVSERLDWYLQGAPRLRALLDERNPPVLTALTVDGWFDEAEAEAIVEMLRRPSSWSWEHRLKPEAISGVLPRPLSLTERRLVALVGLLLPEDIPTDIRRIFINRRRMEAETFAYLMSPWEVFARTFDQVIRLHAIEQGIPFGLMSRTCDLPDAVIRQLRPMLLSALSEAGVMDLSRVPGRVARRVAASDDSSSSMAAAALVVTSSIVMVSSRSSG